MAREDETKEFVVRLPHELHAQVKKRAEREDRSVAATIRVALREYLGIDAEPAV